MGGYADNNDELLMLANDLPNIK